jgi:hypothetical protein
MNIGPITTKARKTRRTTTENNRIWLFLSVSLSVSSVLS